MSYYYEKILVQININIKMNSLKILNAVLINVKMALILLMLSKKYNSIFKNVYKSIF